MREWEERMEEELTGEEGGGAHRRGGRRNREGRGGEARTCVSNLARYIEFLREEEERLVEHAKSLSAVGVRAGERR